MAGSDRNGVGEESLEDGGWRDRLTERGEDAVSRLAQELLDNPIIRNAVSGVMGASEKVSQAQEAAMGALNLPSSEDVEQLARRLRALTQRLERLEDGADQIQERLDTLGVRHLEDRIQRLEAELRQSKATAVSGSPVVSES